MKKASLALILAIVGSVASVAPANSSTLSSPGDISLWSSNSATSSSYEEDGYIVLPKGSPLFSVKTWYPYSLPNNGGTIMRAIEHSGLSYQECLINKYCDTNKPVRYTTRNIQIKPTFDYDAYLYSDNRVAYVSRVDGKVGVVPFRVYNLSYIECVASLTCHPFLRNVTGLAS